jgi:hypothetical protein
MSSLIEAVKSHPWASGIALDVTLPYVEPVANTDDVFNTLKATGYAIECYLIIDIDGVPLPIPEASRLFPHALDHAFVHSKFIPTMLGLDLAIINRVRGMFMRFRVTKIPKRNIVIEKSRSPKAPARPSKRKIKTAR